MGIEPKKALGLAVRKFRQKQGMTQEALAYASGLSLSTLARMETGANEARISTIMRMAKELGVSAASLIGECEAIMRRGK